MEKRYRCKEVQILLAGTAIAPESTSVEELNELLRQGPVDWDLLIRLSINHGLSGLLYQNLNVCCVDYIPGKILERLKRIYVTGSYRNIELSQKLLKIHSYFSSSGIPSLSIKGASQAALIYQDVNLRHFADLDILVRKRDAKKARDLLLELGFKCNTAVPENQLAVYLEKENFFSMTDRSQRIHIDLHWELSGRYATSPICYDDVTDGSLGVNILDKNIPTLGYDDTLLYLCIHGASHCWDKLEPVLSVSEIIKSGKITDWETVLSKANKLKCRRMLILGMLLSKSIYKTDPPGVFRKFIDGDRLLKRISERISNRLTDRKPPAGGYFGWRFSPLHFFARDSFFDALRYFFRLFFNPTVREWDTFPLPRNLLFLHYFLRPQRIIIGKIVSMFSFKVS